MDSRIGKGKRASRDIYGCHYDTRLVPGASCTAPRRTRRLNYVLLAVRAGADWLFNPPKEFMLQPGFKLIAMATPHGRIELEETLIDNEDEAAS